MGKKTIAFYLATVFILMSLFSVIRIQASGIDNDIRMLSSPQRDMMWRFDSSYTYERVYLRLNEADRQTFDLAFASAIMSIDMSSKSTEEIIVILQDIKTKVLNDTEVEYATRKSPMMGSIPANISGICGNPMQHIPYEWTYLHASTAQRNQMDQLLAEAIRELDMSKTVHQIATEMDRIKTDIADQIASSVSAIE